MSKQPSPNLPPWTYNKTEHLSEHAIASSRQITHVIAENPPHGVLDKAFRPVANTLAYDRWAIDNDVLQKVQGNIFRRYWDVTTVVRMVKTPKLWILERINR